MVKLTIVPANLAKATLVVRTHLQLLFRRVTSAIGSAIGLLRLLWVPIDALRVLLVAKDVLLEKLADRYLLIDISMQKFALVALSAHILEPVYAHFFFVLSLV